MAKKKTKVEKLPGGKIRLSKEADTALAKLIGKRPSSLAGAELSVLLDAIVDALWGLNEQGKIEY